MITSDDEWVYHQDERDSAASMGCFLLAVIVIGGALIAITVALIG